MKADHVRLMYASWPFVGSVDYMYGAQPDRKIDCPIKMAFRQQLAHICRK